VTTPSPEFEKMARQLEAAYLGSDDPIAQSGFSGGRDRWVAERSPLVEAIDRPGDFLDVGCANGLLAADVVDWCAARGVSMRPHGIDFGPRLIEMAREHLPGGADDFVVADAWTWEPMRQWTYVYSLLDLSPPELWCEWLRRLLDWVEPRGRLIVGSYGSRSARIPPVDVAAVMGECGLVVTGSTSGGDPPITRFAWTDRS
jgi:SAM-dependent methyltransferase